MINNILVIGTGSIGRRYIQCLKELDVASIYMCDPDEGNRALTESLYSIKSSFASLDEGRIQLSSVTNEYATPRC